MRRKASGVVVLVVAAMLSTGCGSSGGGDIIRVVDQGTVEGCLLNSVIQLLILGQEAQEIINEIENGGSSDVVNTGGNTWSFTVDLSLNELGPPDTRITGTVEAPTMAGEPFEFNNVVITALAGGSISGSADLDVLILNDDAARIWGELNLNDSAADCDIAMTIPISDPLTLEDSLEMIEQRQLAAQVFDLNLFGTIGFVLDFGAIDVGGSAVLTDGSQTVDVTTDSEFGDFSFKLLPDFESLQLLATCLLRFNGATEDIIDAIDAVLEEATGGDDSPNVSFEGVNFVYDDGSLSIEGSVNLAASSVSFEFEDDDWEVSGATAGSVTVNLTGVLNGTVGMSTYEENCTGSLQFINAAFDPDGEDIVFDDGLTILTAETLLDSIEFRIDWGETGGSLEDIENLDGLSMLINGTPMPQIIVTAILFFFFFEV